MTTPTDSIIITHDIIIDRYDLTPRTNYSTSAAEIMADTNLAFFIGPSGIGKTTLAKHCLGYRCLIALHGHYGYGLSLFNKEKHDSIIFENIFDSDHSFAKGLADILNVEELTRLGDRKVTFDLHIGTQSVEIPSSVKIIFTCKESAQLEELLKKFRQPCKIVNINDKPFLDTREKIVHPRMTFP